jgi:hypothetical protein
VSDPYAPRFIGERYGEERVLATATDGEFIYEIEQYTGLRILEPQCEQALAVEPFGTAAWSGASSVILRPATPNPFRGRTTLEFELGHAGYATVEVFDVAGRSVRVLQRGWLEGGDHAVTWLGRNDAGAPVAGGMYFVRLQGSGGTSTRKVVHVSPR